MKSFDGYLDDSGYLKSIITRHKTLTNIVYFFRRWNPSGNLVREVQSQESTFTSLKFVRITHRSMISTARSFSILILNLEYKFRFTTPTPHLLLLITDD